VGVLIVTTSSAAAQQDATAQRIREEIAQLKQEFDARLRATLTSP
jgi:hypothetical protein